jgi:N utilization substance protein B
MSNRSRARELVLQALYAVETGTNSAEEVADEVIRDDKLDNGVLEYARSLFGLSREKAEWADRTIESLASNWRLERIAMIDRIILRMALVELTEMVDVPVKVVLNEAIELAKLYSTANSSAFVNGILDSFVKNSPERFEV